MRKATVMLATYFRRPCLGLTIFSLSLVGLAGCGKEGPERYDVSGTVTFNGKPVPGGRVIFEPDTSKKNSGAQGFANIKDGKYDTGDGGEGHIGGPHILRISGFEGPAAAGTTIKPLFVEQKFAEDLPKDATTAKNFDIPATAAKGLPKVAAPPP